MNRVILGNCMGGMAKTPDKYYDLAVVDPPYGINIAEWDTKEHKPTPEYFEQLFRVSKNQIIWGGNYFADKLPITEAWVCWYKKPFLPQQAHFELAWTSFEIKPKLIEYTYAGNAVGFKNLKVDYNKKSIHPTQKPVDLYRWIFKNYAEPGMKVLDTHGGSMSSVISAIRAGMTIDCYEIDKDYYKDGKQRVINYFSQLDAFAEQPEISWEC